MTDRLSTHHRTKENKIKKMRERERESERKKLTVGPIKRIASYQRVNSSLPKAKQTAVSPSVIIKSIISFFLYFYFIFAVISVTDKVTKQREERER